MAGFTETVVRLKLQFHVNMFCTACIGHLRVDTKFATLKQLL